MDSLQQALAELADIRARVSASTRFHGFAPGWLLGTGLLFVAVAAAQSRWHALLAGDALRYLAVWAVALGVAAIVIAIAAARRARALHGVLAGPLLAAAALQLLPFVAAQAVMAIVIGRFAPASAWLVPGLWQILTGLIGFVSVSTLPRQIAWAAAWYFACGTAVLLQAATGGALSPWHMGVPFAVGNVLIAGILHWPRARI